MTERDASTMAQHTRVPRFTACHSMLTKILLLLARP
jgi:hypothetical protein